MLCLGQIDELKGCIEEREEELSRLRTATASVPTCEICLKPLCLKLVKTRPIIWYSTFYLLL